MTERLRRWARSWEALLACCVLATLVVADATTPGLGSGFNIESSISDLSDTALMILPLTLLIVAREIDISVASIAGLSSCVAGLALNNGASLELAIAIALVVGLACGAFNAFFVVFLGMPSLVVTLGSLALFRGLCYVLLGTNVVTKIPSGLIGFSNNGVFHTDLPLDILPFVALAPMFAVLLHRLPTGRRIYAIGGNPEAARYAGVHQNRIKVGMFMASGFVCAIAGIINIGITSEVSPDALLGYELDALTIVFLGGVSFLGGKGRVSGVTLALILVVALTSALQLHNVSGYEQGTVIGLLLIFSLLLSNTAARVARRLGDRRAKRRDGHEDAEQVQAEASREVVASANYVGMP